MTVGAMASSRARALRARAGNAITRLLIIPVVARAVSALSPSRLRVGGLEFDVSAPGFPAVPLALMRFGLYERAEIAFIRRYLSGADVVIELGASIGVTGAHTLSVMAAEGQYVGVEPNGDLIETLRTTLDSHVRSQRITLLNAALAAVDRTTVHLMRGSDTTGSRITPQERDAEAVPVTGRSLASIVKSAGVEEFAMVCDIEGAETSFIDDSTSLDRCSRLVIELHDTTDDSGHSRTRAELRQKLIDQHGFVVVEERGPVLALGRRLKSRTW